MKRTGGSLVVEALEAEGVALAFGIPGTHNLELYDALATSESVRTVLVTDEQSASFMADGAWRASGRMACVNVVPGAGLTHAMSGIAEAYLDQIPMLVLGCGIRRDSGRAYQLHDVEQLAMVDPVTKGAFRPRTGAEIVPTIRGACALARSAPPGPVFVEIPADLYLSRHDVGTASADASPAAVGGPPAAPDPDPAAVARAAEILGGARRPLLYYGAGALDAAEPLVALAERLEMPVSSTFQGKGIVPESHPLFLWPGFGDAAPPFVRRLVKGCDATLAIGCRFSEVGTGSYGLEPPGPLVHVDIDPEVPGANYAAELPVVADARAFLEALLDRLDGRPRDDGLRDEVRLGHAKLVEAELEHVGGEAVSPFHLLMGLQREMGPDTVFTTDSGNGTFLAMELLRLDQPRKFLAPVDYSCMGYAVPAALGARLARPDCPVVALAGDGAFLMTGLELLTGAREGLGIVVVVLRDRELAQIAQFQSTAFNRKVASGVDDYVLERLAAGVGCPYLALESDDDCTAVLRRARTLAEEGRPVVIEARVDYSRRTWFTRGVVRTSLLRMPWADRLRFVGRALVRRVTG